MVNDINTLGLRITEISPRNNEINVNVNSDIKITFNSDIDTQTIIGNITVVEDSNYEYINGDKYNPKFIPVKGNIMYSDKSIIFKPAMPFKTNTRYIVFVREKSIKDIMHNEMILPFVSTFFTDPVETLPKVIITSPKSEVILDRMPVIEWASQKTDAYLVQIAKDNSFAILSYEKIIKKINNELDSKIDLSSKKFTDGLYYIRVKSINGEWSDDLQIFIKQDKNEKITLTPEDVPEDMIFDELPIDDVVILDYFPKENTSFVSTKLNIIYVKLLGEIKESDIDFNNISVFGSLYDEEDEYSSTVTPQEFVGGSWQVIYDNELDVTYIIYTINDLESDK